MATLNVPNYPEVNRSVLLVRPTAAYFVFLQSCGLKETEGIDPSEWEPTPYLVPDMESPLEEDEWLTANTRQLLAHLLAQTPLEEKDWPESDHLRLMREWFAFEFVGGIFDMVKGPLGRG